MHKTSKGIVDFAAYVIGLLAVMIGAITCYVLTSLGVMTSVSDAAVVMTVISIVGFTLAIVGVTLRARRSGREMIGPLVFGIGLLVATGGSLVVYTLVLYQMISETGATLAFASIAVLSITLIIAGIVYRVYHVERKASRMVVMPPLRRIYTRKIEEGQDGQNG
ncbi:MAG: hypothetical protein SXV54_07760 [Chloroflexota bacterium]|nr:hypothetical protein [Chloroflexota bacterium]